MSNLEVFICELLAIDALAARPVELSEVAALCHEASDDPMEHTVLEVQHLSGVAAATLPRAKLAEVLSSARHHVFEELEDDRALGLIANADVEVDTRVFQ